MARHHALLVALVVVLAGCNAGPGTPSGSPSGAEITHPVELASTNTYPYRLAVTISQDGETVYEHNLTRNGTASVEQLTTLNESGTYTVAVETNITGKLGGEATANRTLAVDGGDRTTLVVNPGNVSVVQQPSSPADSYFRVTIEGTESLEGTLTVIVRQDGETIHRANVTRQHDDEGDRRTLFRHNETGTYQLLVKYDDSFFWTNRTFVVPPATAEDEGARAAINWRFNDYTVNIFGTARQGGQAEA